MFKINSKYTFILLGFVAGKNIDSCKRETPIYALVETEKTSPLEVELETNLPPGYDLMIKVNLYRTTNSVLALNSDQRLICAAEAHSNQMSKVHKCSHQIENEPWVNKRVKLCGWSKGIITEIIACDFNDVDSVIESWQNSSLVSKTLLDPKWKMIGCYRSDNYWVCVLGG